MKLLFSIALCLVFFFSSGQSAELYLWKKDTLQERLDRSDSTANPERHLYLLLELAQYFVIQDWTKSRYYHERALKLARQYPERKMESRVLVSYGNKLAMHNNYPASLRRYAEAMRLCQQEGRTAELSGWLELNLGNLFYKLHDYTKASELYYDALMYFEKDSLIDGKAVAFNNIGLCALKLKRAQTALNYFEKARALREDLQQPNLLAHSNLYLAQAYIELGNSSKADSLLRFSKNYFKRCDAYNFFRKSVIELAKLAKSEGKYEEALRILSEDYSSQSESLYGMHEMEEYLLQGELKKLMGDYTAAEKALKAGIKDAKLHYQHLQSRELYEELQDVYLKKNEPNKALSISREIIYLQDSVEQSRNEALFEILRTQNELSLQETENQQLEEMNKESLEQLKERNILLFMAIAIITLMLVLIIIVVIQSRKLKRAENQLKESHSTLIAIVDNTNNIILSLTASGRITLINQAGRNFYRQILGRNLETGNNFLNALEEPSHSEMWERIIAKGREGKVWQEVSQAELENQTHYLFKSFSPIMGYKKEFQGIIMVGADFTESRKKSLEIEKQKEQLDKANTAKERMLSILAHDLKDSIFSAKSLTDLVLENSEDQPRDVLLEYIELLNQNFTKTKLLLTGLLDWVKTQTQGMKAQPKKFNLNKLSHQVIEGMTLKAENKKLTLNNNIPAYTQVVADEEMIRTVFRNLLGNAIKYTFTNTGVIDLDCELLDNNKLRIHVKDNGQGISDYDQLRLFEVPGRVSTPGTANEEGTGFGLSLCLELLKLNGSELHISSKKGQGSDFYFDLKLT